MTRFACLVAVLSLVLALADQAFASGCGQVQKADVVLLVDESKSINPNDWTKQLAFVSQLVGKLEVDKDKVNIGVICFDHKTRNVFNLTDHSSKSTIQSGIKNLVQQKGLTSTWEGLTKAEEMFATGRKGVTKILLTLTDGQPNGGAAGAAKTKAAAEKLKKTGVTAVAVGVGLSQYDVVLESIASSSKYVSNVNKMSDLLEGDFLDLIVQNIECAVEDTPKPRAMCKQVTKADIVFLVDESGSIDKKDFQKDVTKFMSIAVSQLPIADDQVRVSVYTFGSIVQLVAKLGELSKEELKKKVESMKQRGGQTNTHTALGDAEKELNDRGRKGVQRMVILVTDGASSNPSLTVIKADELKALSPPPTVMAIGVGKKTNDRELRVVATSANYVKHVGNTQQLADEGFIKNELVASLNCAVAEPIMCG